MGQLEGHRHRNRITPFQRFHQIVLDPIHEPGSVVHRLRPTSVVDPLGREILPLVLDKGFDNVTQAEGSEGGFERLGLDSLDGIGTQGATAAPGSVEDDGVVQKTILLAEGHKAVHILKEAGRLETVPLEDQDSLAFRREIQVVGGGTPFHLVSGVGRLGEAGPCQGRRIEVGKGGRDPVSVGFLNDQIQRFSHKSPGK